MKFIHHFLNFSPVLQTEGVPCCGVSCWGDGTAVVWAESHPGDLDSLTRVTAD